MFKKLIFVFSFIFVAQHAFTCDRDGKTGLLPENNLQISIDEKFVGPITSQKMADQMKKAADIYGPIVKAKGGNLHMINLWHDSKVNASAFRRDGNWEVTIYGGLARHPAMTEDSLMLAICHELGHHLGGFPRYEENTDWASNEGQADYFASLKCLKRIFSSENNTAIVSQMTIDQEATQKCQSVYKSTEETALCQRIAMAGKALGSLFANVLGAKIPVTLETPHRFKRKVILDEHPHPQCRLDTYFHGGLCDRPYSIDFSNTDPISGACIQKDGYQLGFRPLCWYVPTASEI